MFLDIDGTHLNLSLSEVVRKCKLKCEIYLAYC